MGAPAARQRSRRALRAQNSNRAGHRNRPRARGTAQRIAPQRRLETQRGRRAPAPPRRERAPTARSTRPSRPSRRRERRDAPRRPQDAGNDSSQVSQIDDRSSTVPPRSLFFWRGARTRSQRRAAQRLGPPRLPLFRARAGRGGRAERPGSPSRPYAASFVQVSLSLRDRSPFGRISVRLLVCRCAPSRLAAVPTLRSLPTRCWSSPHFPSVMRSGQLAIGRMRGPNPIIARGVVLSSGWTDGSFARIGAHAAAARVPRGGCGVAPTRIAGRQSTAMLSRSAPLDQPRGSLTGRPTRRARRRTRHRRKWSMRCGSLCAPLTRAGNRVPRSGRPRSRQGAEMC